MARGLPASRPGARGAEGAAEERLQGGRHGAAQGSGRATAAFPHATKRGRVALGASEPLGKAESGMVLLPKHSAAGPAPSGERRCPGRGAAPGGVRGGCCWGRGGAAGCTRGALIAYGAALPQGTEQTWLI